MSEIRAGKVPTLEELSARLEALKADKETISHLKGVRFVPEPEKIPETIDLWWRVVNEMKPEPLSTTYLYAVGLRLISLEDLRNVLDEYAKKPKEERARLPFRFEFLQSIANRCLPTKHLLDVLRASPELLKPSKPVQQKKSIPVDWPARQKEMAERWGA